MSPFTLDTVELGNSSGRKGGHTTYFLAAAFVSGVLSSVKCFQRCCINFIFLLFWKCKEISYGIMSKLDPYTLQKKKNHIL